MRSFLAAVIAVATSLDIASALVIPENHVVHETRDGLIGFQKAKRMESHVIVPVRIGLKQNEDAMSKAEEWLMQVSDPKSDKFAQHWSQEEVIQAFQPTPETVSAVHSWITTVIHEDRITHTDNKAWFAFDASVAELERLVHAEYHEYHSTANSGEVVWSTDAYHIPKNLQNHIDLITPGAKGIKVQQGEQKKKPKKAPKKHKTAKTSDDPNSLDQCDYFVTPACIQALYGFKPLKHNATVSSNNSLGIFEEGDTFAQEDLDLFYKQYTSYIPAGWGPKLDLIDGATAPTDVNDAGTESDLDFELAIPIIYPQTTTLYQTDDAYWSTHISGIFNTFLDAIDGSYCTYSAYVETGNDPKLNPVYPDTHSKTGYKGKLNCGKFNATNVISISYGTQEGSLPAYYQKRQCDEYLKLGLQGVSIIVASGDYGVGGYPGTGPNCLGPNGTVFNPSQPNGCPWITNVGATKIAINNTVYDPEVAAYDSPSDMKTDYEFASGGGFSTIFTQPKYQSDAVATYFENNNPPYKYYTDGNYTGTDGLYNRNGRGIPDVAANGDNIAYYNRGQFNENYGTSASAPIFAALITRIIEERIANGKGRLGFLNPTLYQHPEILNDITAPATNPGCGSDGFSTAEGWDPVTGLGTPNYPKMSKLFNSLP